MRTLRCLFLVRLNGARLWVIPWLLRVYFVLIQHDFINQSKRRRTHFEIGWADNYTAT